MPTVVIEQTKAELVAIGTALKQHNNMQVINHEGQFVIDSRDVAEMVDKEHRHVIRDIRTIIEHLGGQTKIGQSYFIESEYTNPQNKQQPCYLLTKIGL